MERLVHLYDALDQPHKAAPWKERLAEFDQIESYKKASAKRP
jgi:hypothetical protein